MRGIALIMLRIGILEVPLWCGIEPSSSISYGVSLQRMSTEKLSKQEFTWISAERMNKKEELPLEML